MRDGEQPKIGHRYFVAHVAQISRGNAQANAVNSTDLAWSGLVRDQEVGGSNPLAPTTSISLCEFELRDIKPPLPFPHFVAHVAQLGPAPPWVGRNRGRFSQPIPSGS